MSTPAVTPTNPLAEFGGVSIDAPSPQGTTASTTNPLAEFDGVTIPDQNDSTKATPQQTGEITNDVGQKVIVPKEGESFSDTMKRAVAYHKSLTPEQQKAALDAESGTIPAKAAQTLGAAAAIGVGGEAALAAPGELVAGIRAVPGAAEAVLDHAEAFAKGVATKYPTLVSAAAKMGVPTTAAGYLIYLYEQAKKAGSK